MIAKAALIGCGAIGARYDEAGRPGIFTHAGLHRATPGLALACAADPDPERLTAFGAAWGVSRLYASHEELLAREQPDLVSVAVPDALHETVIRDALRLAKPRIIFTEKPLAEDISEAIEAYEACLSANTLLIVDYIRRWDENTVAAKRFLAEGGLGRISAATGWYVRGIRHNGCQLVNFLRFLLGEVQVAEVFGAANHGSLSGDPSLNLRLGLAGGVEAVMQGLDRAGYDFSIFELDIVGAKGRLRITDSGRRFAFQAAEADEDFPNFRRLYPAPLPWPSAATDTYGQAMRRAGLELSALYRGLTPLSVNAATEAIKDMLVIEAALASAGSGKPEPVALFQPQPRPL